MMQNSDGELTRRIRGVLAEVIGLDPEKIPKDANFSDDLGADSLDLIEVIMELESEFGVAIDSAQIETLQSIDAVENFITSSKN